METDPIHPLARDDHPHSPAPDTKIRGLIDLLPAVAWEADPQTFQFTYVSGAAERLFGYPVSQWLDEPGFWTTHVHPDDREQAAMLLRVVVEQGRDHQFEYRLVAADGRVRWVRNLATVGIDSAGTANRLMGLIVDLTEPREAEAILRERETLFRAVYDSSPLGIALWSADGRIHKANRAFADMLGVSVRELTTGGRASAFIHPEDGWRLLAAQDALLSGKQTADVFEQRYLHRDGSVVSVLVSLSLVHVPGRTDRSFVSKVVNLTQVKNLSAEHIHAQKLELLERVAGGIAHDFNNLLTVIASATQSLWLMLDSGDSRRESVAEIQTAASAAGDLTRQLLGFARRPRSATGMLELNRAIASFERLLRRGAGDKIQLVTALSSQSLNIRIEAIQIDQILMNLVFNARDAMPDGGAITISTTAIRLHEPRVLRTGVLAPGSFARLDVRDTGAGMSDSTTRQIFEPFFTTKECGKGTGLGLAVVDTIVRQCGGAMDVHSTPGRGTRFEILLPRFETADR